MNINIYTFVFFFFIHYLFMEKILNIIIYRLLDFCNLSPSGDVVDMEPRDIDTNYLLIYVTIFKHSIHLCSQNQTITNVENCNNLMST